MRRVVQITSAASQFFGITYEVVLYALCDDGTMWYCKADDDGWQQFKGPPTEEKTDDYQG